MIQIDLNCDLGEGFPDDAQLIELVSSVNIACGSHAGDDATMRSALRLAIAAGVNAGAHPGYADRANFGRVAVELSPDAVGKLITGQVNHLMSLAREQGATLSHVKPHGALYHAAGHDREIADAIVDAVCHLDRDLAVVCAGNSALATAARALGLRCIAEAFADRRYQADGTLVPRSQPGATIDDVADACEQALQILQHQQVCTPNGETIAVSAQTLCVHGDGPHARRVLTALRQTFNTRHIRVMRF